MADLSTFEKYTDSWRIDHPDSGDVRKSPYAKWVISDFKVDDPNDIVGTIHSLVKVTGDWGESDYIPLFYHPKAKYWDDATTLATAFNKENQYFEKAWMSFRCDDEVAVMLKDGVPVAAVGFADGVPRIGENILKSKYIGHGWDTAGEKVYAKGDLGPDNLNLGLLLPIKKFPGDTTSSEMHVGPLWNDIRYWSALSRREVVHYSDAYPYPVDKLEVDMTEYQDYTSNDFNIQTYSSIIGNYLASIGPILYFIQQVTGLFTYRCGPLSTYNSDPIIVKNNWTRHIYSDPEQDFPEVEALADAWIALYSYDFTESSGDKTLPSTHGGSGIGSVGKALYTDKLYNKVIKLKNMPSEFVDDLAMYNLLSFDTAVTPGSPPVWPPVGSLAAALASVTSDVDLQFYAHPHTKDELQTAGMWPAGAS